MRQSFRRVLRIADRFPAQHGSANNDGRCAAAEGARATPPRAQLFRRISVATVAGTRCANSSRVEQTSVESLDHSASRPVEGSSPGGVPLSLFLSCLHPGTKQGRRKKKPGVETKAQSRRVCRATPARREEPAALAEASSPKTRSPTIYW